MKGLSTNYNNLKEFIDNVPVIETHEHHYGWPDKPDDALLFLLGSYYRSDFYSSAFKMSSAEDKILNDKNAPIEKRIEIFNCYFNKSKNTTYGKDLQLTMKNSFGIEEVTVAAITELNKNFEGRTVETSDKILNDAGIKACIADVGITDIISGKNKNYSKLMRFVIQAPGLHNLHTKQNIDDTVQNLVGEYVKSMRSYNVTSLDDYLVILDKYFKKAVDFGVVAVKDQSAYIRKIEYDLPAKADAERLFNRILLNPRDMLGEEESKPLDDYLFHQIVRLAGIYELPIQIHTGHMAGIRNDITKTNAAHIIPVLELYQDVWFDLFHGNWPYMDEFLYIGKNYPNVSLDLCWAQSIDADYCVEFMRRAIKSVPHNKIMAFGGDTHNAEMALGHLEMARISTATALSQLIDEKWLSMKDARQIACDWFYNNPNEVFKIGFDNVNESSITD